MPLLLSRCWPAYRRALPRRATNPRTPQSGTRSTQWTADFNARRVDKVCDLFAPDLVAQFRGQPETGHAALCDQLKRSLTDPDKSFHYSLAIKEILVSGDVAVVRLVWTLKVERAGAPAVTTEETDMDIFRRQPDGHWRIVRFIAYD